MILSSLEEAPVENKMKHSLDTFKVLLQVVIFAEASVSVYTNSDVLGAAAKNRNHKRIF